MKSPFLALAGLILANVYGAHALAGHHGDAKTAAPAAITLGNGERNWIVVDGMQRNGSTLTFSEVNIDGNGWLVMHPFEDGKANGDKYVAASYLEDGKNTNADIEVYKGMETGENFIVMLHRDVNENQVLDFVFVSDTHVMDTAVLEGTKMIAHIIAAP